MRNFESAFYVCLFSALLLFGTKFAQKQTGGFTILSISSNHPFNPTFETHPLSSEEQNEVDRALNQPYSFFGWGGQAFVFFSEDGKYVLKFFKQRLFKKNWVLNFLPLPSYFERYRQKRNRKRKDKYLRDFFSYKESFNTLKEETALLYCHLNPTVHLNRSIEIIDRLGIHHLLNADQFEFILQRRGERVIERFHRLSNKENSSELKETFKQIFNLVKGSIAKGFYNRDPFIPNNCGFLEDRAIHIDVGRFVKNDTLKNPEGKKEELFRILIPFGEWIKINFPDFYPFFQEELREAIK